MGYAKDLNSMQGLGYRHIINYLDGKITLDRDNLFNCKGQDIMQNANILGFT